MRIQYSLLGLLLTTLLVAVACDLIAWFPRLVVEIAAGAVVVWGACLVFTRRQPLRFFVRYVNPVLCLVVLVICLMAGTTDLDANPWNYKGLFQDAIPTYFVGKAIFCAGALFLLGKLVEQGIKTD